ncbi:MAG: alpha/beta hydrolase [Gammaproteobacteria bacterium]|nr:alpha/beta hydrolase [Gammaproteobacteria bacterium]
MPLDPQCAALIEAAAKAGAPFGAPDHLAIRAGYEAVTAAYVYDCGPLAVTSHQFAGPAATVAVRVYRPPGGSASLPALVFYHGGGWVVGSLDSHDHLCRHLANAAGVVVLSIDYRLAPEHPFPAALEDCLAAVHWAARDAELLGIDATRLAVGGDSAGGQLAASVALALRDGGGPTLKFQLLIYPVCDLVADNDSLHENATGYLLTRAAYQKMCDWYLTDRTQWADPRMSPQHALHHRALPPALVQTAEFDPLRDEGRRYAETLRAAGVPVEYQCYSGMIHGFARMGGKVDTGKVALDDAAAALRTALTT